MKRTILLMAAAGFACAAPAMADNPTPTDGYRQATLRGHVYINMATGERRVTMFDGGQGGGVRLGSSIWDNTDIAGNGNWFWGVDDGPTMTSGHTALDWGDINGSPLVNGFDIAYAGDCTAMGIDPGGVGTPGFNALIGFYGAENGFNDADRTDLAGFQILDLPGHSGADCTVYEGWIVTIDLEGTGFEFTISGPDEDLDGATDFGYSYAFQQPTATVGTVGPFLVWPANLGGAGTAMGVEDAFDEYDDLGVYINTWWFGGGAPPAVPYASFLMNLYGGTSCRADLDGDGNLTLNDFVTFRNLYVSGDLAADFDGNGSLTLNDFVTFRNEYVAGCP